MSIKLSNLIFIFSKKKLPDIDVDALIMERILNSSAYHIKQIVYQGFNKKDLSSIRNTNLSLERLWHYSSNLTQNRNVSCLSSSQQNHVS
jgi:hypothetical protein